MTTDAAGQATAGRPTRVFIYGSCVSRDTFEYLPRQDFELITYVARQSLISAMSVSTACPAAVASLPSAFQQRNLSGDFKSSLVSQLNEASSRTDVILWDLVDERLGVYRLPDGAYITRSLELISSGAEALTEAVAEHVAFGTDEHLALWTTALGDLLEVVDALRPPKRLLLLDMPWATHTEDGRPTVSSFSVSASTANRLYEPYFAAARDAGTTLVIDRPVDVRSSSDHQWGEAPFHYSSSTYQMAVHALVSQLHR